MMNRILNRIKGFDIKRMFKMIRVISKRSGESFLHVFLDIFRCWIKFGSGYMDYYLFYFETLSDQVKDTYINVGVNRKYVRDLNDKNLYHVLNDKIEFLNKYKEFVKRDFLDIRNCSKDEFYEFLNKHKEFVAKPLDGFCGYGIELIDSSNSNADDLFKELNDKKLYLLEERIVQHRSINEIYHDSINTLRIVTLNVKGKVTVMFSCMRIGNNGKHVDNFNNGGLMAIVDSDGYIRKPVLDKENKVYEAHPMTHKKIVGFKVPHFDKAVEVCKKLATVTPELGYCGWDIAILEDGIEVIEGNQIPGYDVYQSREQLAPSIEGLKPKFDEVIYPDKSKKKIFAKGFNAFKFIWVLFIGLMIDLLLGNLNINIQLGLYFSIAYLFLYRRIDTRPFYKTVVYILLVTLLIFTYDYCILNFFDLNNLENVDVLYAIKSMPLDVLKILVKDSLVSFGVCLIALYFILPLIDKLVEKFNYTLGYILTVLVSLADTFLVVTLVLTYVLLFMIVLSA